VINSRASEKITSLNNVYKKYMPDNLTPGLEYSVYFGYFDNDVEYFDREDTELVVIGIISSGDRQTGFTTDGTNIDTLTNGMFRGGPNRSAQWIGYFTPHKSGPHKFHISSYESSLLWIGKKNETSVDPLDDPLIVNNNKTLRLNRRQMCHIDDNISTSSGEIILEKFATYPIRMQYGFREKYSMRKMSLCFQEPYTTELIYNFDGYVNFNDEVKQSIIAKEEAATIGVPAEVLDEQRIIDIINYLEIQEKVVANYQDGDFWLSGKVVEKNDDGSFNVQFDDNLELPEANGVLEKNLPRFRIRKVHENIMPAIVSIGWYFISSSKSQTFEEYVLSHTQPAYAKATLYNIGYFLSDSWSHSNYFKDAEWDTTSTLHTMMSPHVGYWIYITKFEVGEMYVPIP